MLLFAAADKIAKLFILLLAKGPLLYHEVKCLACDVFWHLNHLLSKIRITHLFNDICFWFTLFKFDSPGASNSMGVPAVIKVQGPSIYYQGKKVSSHLQFLNQRPRVGNDLILMPPGHQYWVRLPWISALWEEWPSRLQQRWTARRLSHKQLLSKWSSAGIPEVCPRRFSRLPNAWLRLPGPGNKKVFEEIWKLSSRACWGGRCHCLSWFQSLSWIVALSGENNDVNIARISIEYLRSVLDWIYALNKYFEPIADL